MTLDPLTQVILCAIIFVSGLIGGMLIVRSELKSVLTDTIIYIKKGE